MTGQDFQVKVLKSRNPRFEAGKVYTAKEIVNYFLIDKPEVRESSGECPLSWMLVGICKSEDMEIERVKYQSAVVLEIKFKLYGRSRVIKINPEDIDLEHYEKTWSVWHEDGEYVYEITADKSSDGCRITTDNAYINIYAIDEQDEPNEVIMDDISWRLTAPFIENETLWRKCKTD